MYSYNENIEQAFLGSIIFDNSIIEKTKLTEDDFSYKKNKMIFRMFKILKENGKDITPLVFKSFIEHHNLIHDIGYGYFGDIEEQCEHSSFWKSYEENIFNNSKQNKIKRIKQNINDNNIDQSIKLLSELSAKKEKGNNIIDLANKFEEFKDNFRKRGGLGYKGPYEILDKYIGGIIPGKVYCIVAYSGVGKSNFSYSYITDALKKDKKVIVFSLEVQKEMLFNNLLKSYYNINQTQILKDDFVYEIGDFEKLYVYDDIYKLEQIKEIIKQEKADVVVIDFIQNIQVQGNSEYEKMTTVAQELQQVAITTNTTIFNLSQANNDSRFKDSGKIQPKGSGAIFASSDIILALSRDGNNLQLNLLKNKYGPSDKNFLIIPDFRNIQFTMSRELQSEEIQKEETDF